MSMWEHRTRSGAEGEKMVVKVNWLYHKMEVQGAGTRDIKVKVIFISFFQAYNTFFKVEDAVFESEHSDDNSVQSITR